MKKNYNEPKLHNLGKMTVTTQGSLSGNQDSGGAQTTGGNGQNGNGNNGNGNNG